MKNTSYQKKPSKSLEKLRQEVSQLNDKDWTTEPKRTQTEQLELDRKWMASMIGLGI